MIHRVGEVLGGELGVAPKGDVTLVRTEGEVIGYDVVRERDGRL